MNNVAQQVGSAIGVALLSTLRATATGHYLTHHPGLCPQHHPRDRARLRHRLLVGQPVCSSPQPSSPVR